MYKRQEEYLEGVAVIERQAQKMSLLINRLLDMTRLEFGTRKLAKEDTDVSLMVETLCEELDTGARGISLERDIKEHLHAQADAHLLSRAVMNLLENARKYGHDNGHIRVKLYDNGDNLILEVEDDGIGIAPEHQDKIWRRFYQVNSSRQAGSGLGLGPVSYTHLDVYKRQPLNPAPGSYPRTLPPAPCHGQP